jgi:hypothetical protein
MPACSARPVLICTTYPFAGVGGAIPVLVKPSSGCVAGGLGWDHRAAWLAHAEASRSVGWREVVSHNLFVSLVDSNAACEDHRIKEQYRAAWLAHAEASRSVDGWCATQQQQAGANAGSRLKSSIRVHPMSPPPGLVRCTASIAITMLVCY